MAQKMAKPEHPRRNRRDLDDEIDQNLKRAFDKVAEEPLPSRFTDLLEQLRNTEAGGKS
ncbi:NepR family anti-sigma factor [Aestuariivita boseongensis]|uniref:NepR family anti-sigma factor n=1 Tax=Aestuariivita boseongensis TaxID=1470562 RepID=UPI0012FC9818|nr:NepR family anti-sigma factor [Aestuariivita boseongensis]